MKKKKVFKNGSKIYAKSADKDFSLVIRESLERGESLEQLSERIGEDTVPNFYGAQFRGAYNEGFEAGSAYGYEQPLDLHDAMMQQLYFLNQFPKTISWDFNSKEPETVEAEFEVIESKTGATFICEVQAIGGKRCVVQCDTCRNNEGQLVGAAKDPGEDIIQTPLGEMTVTKWDLHNIGYQHLTNEENAKLFGWAVKDPEQWKEHNLVTREDYQKLLLGGWKSEPNNETDKK
jgi:hypothetical protein